MIVRTNSLVPVFRNELGLDRLFNNLFRDFPFEDTSVGEAGRYPAVDAWEDEKAFHVEAEMPGLKEKDIEISVLGNELRIVGGTETGKEEKDNKYHRRERFVGRFSRVLRFPVDIEDGKVEAKYESGILSITLPKAAAALPRRIEVKS
jgi:HSP20 family protein